MIRSPVRHFSTLLVALALCTGLAACSSTSTLRLCNDRLEPITSSGKPVPTVGRHP